MQRLSRIASSEGITLYGADCDISGITADSREVKPGYLFIAIQGTKHDGTAFIAEAVSHGAVAVLISDEITDRETGAVPLPLAGGEALTASPDITILTSPDIRKAVSAIAAKFYPRQPESIAAVTGTSGKTSVAQFTREIWQSMGYASASIGTLGLVTSTESRYGSLTTPDAITLHRLLDECAGQGITHMALEASSHGLALHRLDHVRVKAGGFTNLSRDHLDFHETMEAYLAAKLRLYKEIVPGGSAAVLNADIPEFDLLARTVAARGLKVISYGEKGKDIRLLGIDSNANNQRLRVDVFGKTCEILLPLIGAYQAWNGLCALGLVIGCGGDAAKAAAGLGKVTGVAGRLQLVGHSAKGGAVFVDYAHKPDALENALKALRPHLAAHKRAKLGIVFGCGGNRDKGKRPLMGKIAQRLADWVIVTDDNPRHEEPAAIRREILAGAATGPSLLDIGDRARAIEAGINRLRQGDVLIIAGKGHENGQIIGDDVHPFDDAETARKVLGA
jgi:UDP-N-acetylmuramoyl-L-alanyl-D-glutamate--2,6-diaminopimelate ligase